MATIAHPTSMTPLDYPALVHALALARARQSEVTLIHVGDQGSEASPAEAQRLLQQWGAPDKVKVVQRPWGDGDPADSVLQVLEGVDPQLCVLATSRREGIARALLESRAEAIARNAPCPVLVLPEGIRGFADAETGELHLTRVVVAAGDDASAREGTRAAARFIDQAGASHTEILLLHHGDSGGPTSFELDSDRTVTWREVKGGSLEEALEESSVHASMLVMATRGPNSILDVVWGTHTERAVQRAQCPVLEVKIPVAS